MIPHWSERRTRLVQGLLALGWVLVIASLFWPATSRFTDPHDPWALPAWTITSADGVAHPYPVGLRLWWNLGIPALILTVVILGHDAWRRICPLSFFAQIPRRLGLSRTHLQAGGGRTPVLVAADSWWARHALEIQFALLWAGLSLRLVLINADPVALAVFLGAVILAALIVGLRYGGKTWCHYVCPMAPVQYVYAGPRGLLTTSAASSTTGVSQSMCRQSSPAGDVSACVACTAPCPDIDLERHYWEHHAEPARRAIVYGYLGLVLGFLAQQALQGERYNATAFWYDQTDWALLNAPGWIIAGQALPVPRWLAAPVLLALSTALCVAVGFALERWWSGLGASPERTRHRLMIASAVIALAVLLWTRVLPGLGVLPASWLVVIGSLVIGALAIWAYRSWQRSRVAWHRETMATSLRRRLAQAPLAVTTKLGDRRLEDLTTDEVHLLAHLATDLDLAQRQQLYRGVLSDVMANGQHHGPASVALLAGLRQQLALSDEDHQALMAEIAGTAFDDPRLRICRQELERLVVRHLAAGHSLSAALAEESDALADLRQRHGLSETELQALAAELTADDGALSQAAMVLAQQIAARLADTAALGADPTPLTALICRVLDERGRGLMAQLVSVLEALGGQTAALAAARTAAGAGRLAPAQWRERLPAAVVAALEQAGPSPTASDEAARAAILGRLHDEDDPLLALLAAQRCGTVPTALAQRLRDDPRLPAFLRPAIAAGSAWRVTLAVDDGPPLPLDALPATIGRDARCTLPIAHHLVSRQHARLERVGDTLWWHDLGGTNGSLVRSQWVRGGSLRLDLPDTVRLGGTDGPRLTIARCHERGDDPILLLARIGTSSVGRGLPVAALLSLAAEVKTTRHAPGTTLIACHQAVTALIIVLEGCASARTPDGQERGRIGPGETLGELGVVTREPASATVVAITEVVCAELPAERFRMLLADQPGIAHTLLIQVGHRLISTLRAPATAADPDLSVTLVPQ